MEMPFIIPRSTRSAIPAADEVDFAPHLGDNVGRAPSRHLTNSLPPIRLDIVPLNHVERFPARLMVFRVGESAKGIEVALLSAVNLLPRCGKSEPLARDATR